MCKRKETYGSCICKVKTHNTVFKADRQSSCLRYNQLLCGRPLLGVLMEGKMENRPYQRKGVSSNTQAGKDFENIILFFLENNGITVEPQTKVEIGINAKKEHAFDFGNNSILVECKSQTWTETGNAPSAKIKNWSDAMFSFYLAPKNIKNYFLLK